MSGDAIDGREAHVPVLLDTTIELLAPALATGGWVADCTVGLGGHAEALLERCPEARLLAIDRDIEALVLARDRLDRFGDRVRFASGPFSLLREHVETATAQPLRGVLADLGVSSMQLDEAHRGFAFRFDGPLDMRMGTTDTDLTAAEVVNTYSEDALATIFEQYGEERRSRRIARGIVDARRQEPLSTTGQLARLIEELKPAPRPRRRAGDRKGGRPGRAIHPATQAFQALRIEVNQELEELRQLLEHSIELLEKDGRLAVISYHSLEDRIVKHGLRDLARGEIEPVTGRPRAETQLIEVLTRRPVRPTEAEIERNPRARSARLRAARRL
ncbi:MAG: 16S rRNA (cytosine(1402)-N(4))-methyltransferase RsmH [Acidobacteriota bacterium]